MQQAVLFVKSSSYDRPFKISYYCNRRTVSDEEAEPHEEVERVGEPAAAGGGQRHAQQPEHPELYQQHRVEEPER